MHYKLEQLLKIYGSLCRESLSLRMIYTFPVILCLNFAIVYDQHIFIILPLSFSRITIIALDFTELAQKQTVVYQKCNLHNLQLSSGPLT